MHLLAKIVAPLCALASFDASIACAQSTPAPPDPAVRVASPDRVDPAVVASQQASGRQRGDGIRSTPAIALPATVQPAAATAPEGAGVPGSLFVGAISIQGLQALTPADFADIVADRIGQTLRPRQLLALTNALADRMRARGFVFATATIAPQQVANANLVVQADEGRIDEVRCLGTVTDAVRATLAPLANGKPVRLPELERRLQLAADLDGSFIRSTRYYRDGPRGVLQVELGRDHVQLRTSLTNQGTRTIGPIQARIEAQVEGLIDHNDAVILTYSLTPLDPSELQFARIRYSRRISPAGTSVALTGSLSATQPGSYLDPLDLRTRNWAVSLSLVQPLLLRHAASFWLEGEIGLRRFTQWRAGLVNRRERLATARLALYGNARLGGGLWRMSASLTQGLGVTGMTAPGDPLSPRPDAGDGFTDLELWNDWTTELGHRFSLRLAAAGRLSGSPLPMTEEMTLGGAGFLRGYDWGERSGDQGVAGMAELRWLVEHPLGLVTRTQFYAYADGGSVSNHRGGPGGGSLASAGGGLRIDVARGLGASFEVAVPLSGPRYDTGTQSPKLNFGLYRNF